MASKWITEPLQGVISYIAKGIPPAYVEVECENTVRVLNQKCNRDFAISYVESRLHDLSKRSVPQEKYLQDEDILINSTGTGTAGRIAQLSNVPFPTIVDGHMIILRGNEKVTPRYLGYALKAQQATVLQFDEGSTGQTELNRDRLLTEIEVSYPVSLEEQEAIAATLSALDARIVENKKINHHLEQMAQAIFKSWFVENAPDDWDYVDLGVVTTEIRTKVKEQQIPVLSAVKTGNLVLSEDYFTKQVYSKDIGKYIVVEPNDFAYNPARINIGSIGINGFDSSGCVSPVYVVFRAEPEYHYFLSFFLKSPNFQEEVRVRASGSVRQSLNYGDFALIQVLYPPLDVVRKFNFQYEGILSTLRRLDEENSRLAEIRDTLLPRLMSGELSIADRSDVK
ncbi:MAG: restriction endonuclease subunit S [Dehalococcoides mccartyi]|uniref:restriction endonuclease subunit S n=1 Tax=Dehalococcoides mccartyi TaxID=61435 RepID=UPI0025CA6D9E|nr:restriction endonuclease subunit S [Dehalococcoides mccartyi]MDN4186084.1 restriction endonuclease subunit S [Dehalococcoides mccartyi]